MFLLTFWLKLLKQLTASTQEVTPVVFPSAFMNYVRGLMETEKASKQRHWAQQGVHTSNVLRKFQLLPAQQPLPLKESRVQTLTARLILSGGVQGVVFE